MENCNYKLVYNNNIIHNIITANYNLKQWVYAIKYFHTIKSWEIDYYGLEFLIQYNWQS